MNKLCCYWPKMCRQAAFACFLLLSLLAADVYGFWVTTGFPNPSRSHLDITKAALINAAFNWTTNGPQNFEDPKQPLFRVHFRRAVANVLLTVPLPDLNICDYHPGDHFDSESFGEGRQRVRNLRRRIIEEIKANRTQNARMLLGGALHTVQDFYSHSNWLELGHLQETYKMLGNDNDHPTPALAGRDDATCIDSPNPDPDGYYWNNINTNLLTSGYFNSTLMGGNPSKPAGKCSHGGRADATKNTSPRGGINKDTNCSAHGYLHFQAAELAENASVEFIESLRCNLTDCQFANFLGVKPLPPATLCVALSLSGQVASSIAALLSIMESNGGPPDLPGSINYVIPLLDVPGIDSVVLQSVNLSAISNVLTAVSLFDSANLTPRAMYGLDLAIGSLPWGSTCLVISNAPAGDKMLLPFVAAHAQDNGVKVHVLTILPDPSSNRRRRRRAASRRRRSVTPQCYEKLSKGTGGTVVEVYVDEMESTIRSLFNDALSRSQVTLFAADNYIDGQFTFTVDLTVSNVIVTISGSRSASLISVNITSPSGSTVTKYLPEVAQTEMKVYLMDWLYGGPGDDAVPLGTWTAIINNDGGPIGVKVTASSAVSFTSMFATFIDGVTPGYLPLTGIPTIGVSTYSMMIDVAGAVDPVTQRSWGLLHNVTSVLLQADDGSTLLTLPALEMYPLQQYVANLPVLDQGFRVVIEGFDAGINKFQRYNDKFVSPSSVGLQVRVQGDGDRGTRDNVTVMVNVTNYGSAMTYYLRVNDAMDFYLGNDTIRIDLAAGESRLVLLKFCSCGANMSMPSRGGGSADEEDGTRDRTRASRDRDSADEDDSAMDDGEDNVVYLGGTSLVTISVGLNEYMLGDYRVFPLTLGPCTQGGSCVVKNVKSSCTISSGSSCSSATWTAHFSVRDRSVGLHSVSAVSDDAKYSLNVVQFQQGTPSNVNGFFTGSCCYRTAKIVSTNTQGGVAVCDLAASAVKKPPSKCDDKLGWKKDRCQKKEARREKKKKDKKGKKEEKREDKKKDKKGKKEEKKKEEKKKDNKKGRGKGH